MDSLKPLSKKEFEMFTDVNFQLDTSKFILSPDALKALESLRTSYMIDKVNANSLGYINKPEELVASLMRGDVAISLIDHLIELNTTNRTGEE